MRASPLSIGSIALNVVLIVALIVMMRSDGEAPEATPVSSSIAAKEGPAGLFAEARAQGVSEDMAYRLAFVSARAAAASTVPDEYWKPSPRRSAALREAEYKSAVATRELLVNSFGPDASNQNAFVEVFQPLRQRFGFLSPDKQVLLQQILFETADSSLTFNGRNSQDRSERSRRIRALLDDNEFHEYQLRESPLAARLANGGFDFTEAEFRAVYDAANAGDPRNAGADPLQAATPAIKQALSPDRFVEFERARDPMYRWLRSGADRFGIGQDAIVTAYTLIQDTNARALELKVKFADPPRMLQARTELFATRDRQLKTLLGEDMFSYIAARLQVTGKSGRQWAGDPSAAFIPAN